MQTTKQTIGKMHVPGDVNIFNCTVPPGLRVRPCEDGTGEAFVEDWYKLDIPIWRKFDAEHRGVRVALADCA